jgi:hypothetical protein
LSLRCAQSIASNANLVKEASATPDRAFDTLDAGGILSIKAHNTKNIRGHVHLDGVDQLYMNYLDRLFCDIEQRYADTIEWTTLGRLATSLSASVALATARGGR